MMRNIIELQEMINLSLKSQVFPEKPHELYEPFRYMLSLGGKRMRPVMLLHACEMFGSHAEKAMPQAIAVELFHNFTLIHDDIMDHAPLRRGLPTVHKKFSSTIAILSGDAMLVKAYQYLVQADNALIPVLINLLNEAAIKVCEGQQFDMNFEKMEGLAVSDYLNMIELKTASLIATSLKMGALAGGASDADADHMYEFGTQLGISFQLQDDWLDSFGTAEKVGKQPGGDILQNKKTFLLIEAMNAGDEMVKQELTGWYQKNDYDPQEKIAAVLELFDRVGIRERTREETTRHYTKAFFHLDQISLPDSSKSILRQFAENLLHRDN